MLMRHCLQGQLEFAQRYSPHRYPVGWGGGVAASLTYGRRTRVLVRDKMIDRVAPCRGAAAQSHWAVRAVTASAVGGEGSG
jgi:hypothetical protein